MNQMSVLGADGDTKIKWDPTDPSSVMDAESMFKCLTDKGYRAFSVKGDGRGTKITKFDVNAGEIVMLRPLAGG